MKKTPLFRIHMYYLCGTLLSCISSVALSESPDTRPSALHNKYNETKIRELIQANVLGRKNRQMTQAERESLAVEDVGKYYLGSILAAGEARRATNRQGRDRHVRRLSEAGFVDAYENPPYLRHRRGARAQYRRGGPIFPTNIGLGRNARSAPCRKNLPYHRLEVAATGLNWEFSPCIAVPQDITVGPHVRRIR